ncbi:MAG: hypothetical protein GX306_05770 [Clostridiales bacterium]|nr:hypothetical protein [Clostridiales bacterium]
MVCNTCGRHTQNENANFCEYCGSSFRENIQDTFYAVPQGQPVGQAGNMAQEKEAYEPPISFMNWLGTYAIILLPTFIPFGWIISLVMLCVWAFTKNTSTSKRNWSRATLIFSILYFIIFIVMMIILLNSPLFKSIMKSTMDLGGFNINNIY